MGWSIINIGKCKEIRNRIKLPVVDAFDPEMPYQTSERSR